MTSIRWTHSNKCVYNIGYHIIWCTKYRRKLLSDPDIIKRLKELLNQKSADIKVNIEIMEIMPDHVHLFVKSSPSACPHWIVQQLKGYSSRMLRREYSSLRTRVPSMWTRSYYIESCGHISESTVKKYIEDQKGK